MARVEGCGELMFKHEWLYLIDSGGQPQFHELLPTFVHHISAAAFFVKLNETLKSHPTIEYYKDDILCGKPYSSSSNHLQTLQNCLQAMQSRDDADGITQCPKLFFIGTHPDLENKEEPIKSKNAQLLEMLLQHHSFSQNIVFHSLGNPDQLLYIVNAKTPSKVDKKVAADFRQDVIKKCHTQEHKIPITWFLLEQLLQDLSKD